MRLEDYDTGDTYLTRVLSTDRITAEAASEDVREIVLEVEHRAFVYEPGQSIGVIVSGQHALGHPHHFRLYSIADVQQATPGSNHAQLTLCVRRCHYIDEYSGETYPGIASNYLCDRVPGDSVTINGPFGMPFTVPDDREADLLLIGMGTGIAPFRALVKHIYRDVPDWRGQIRLFYGARSGLEMLYMNDQRDDFAQYYDKQTFSAFKALSPRPHWEAPVAIDQAIAQHAATIKTMLDKPHTHIYVAGREQMLANLNQVFANMVGSEEQWARRRAELQAGKRWLELIY